MKVSRCLFLIFLLGFSHLNLLANSPPNSKFLCSGEIVEIEALENGISAIYFRVEKGYQGKSVVGLQGEVFSDNTWKNLIGNFEVKEEFPGYCYAKISKELSSVKVGQAIRILISGNDDAPAPAQIENIWGKIVEVENNKNMEYIYIKINEKQQVLSKGTVGEIYNDTTMSQLVGKVKIMEEFPGFYYAKIIEQNSVSTVNQVVRFSSVAE